MHASQQPQPISSPELTVALDAARAGGAVVSRYYREGVAMRHKETWNLVSDADVESEQAIIGVITEAFPDHAVLAEESRQDEADAESLWIVDPIDGTNNFAHAIPHFAISIACYRNGAPLCGVIYNPIREGWFVTIRGEGAWRNGERVSVSPTGRLDESLVALGFYYDRGTMMEATLATMRDLFGQKVHGIRRFGTASLDLALVACGQVGAYFEYQLSPWDFAAGRLFVEEAGGTCTTCHGEPLPLARTGLLASNGHLHPTMLEIISRHWSKDDAAAFLGEQ
jgi:myo-inositol-1(or 4)-monophosphatase